MLGIQTAMRMFGLGPAASVSGTSQPTPWFTRWATGGGNTSVNVNENTALNYLAVFNCVSLIASTMAAMPYPVYKRTGKKRERATDRPEYRLLNVEYNPESSAMSSRESGNAHVLTWGNSYTQIVRNKSGSTVLRLQVQSPDIVTVVRNSRQQLGYEIRERGTSKVLATLPAEEVLHVPGIGGDGIVGYSPIRIARTAIKCGAAMDAEAERYITNGIRPPGAVKFAAGKKFKDTQEANLWRNRFKEVHAGEDSSTNVMVLEDGADWVQLGLDPESAQLLESRKFSRREICGLYRVPPHMVGDVEASTSWGTGIGEQKEGFVTFTLLSWMKRDEQEKNRKLFGGGEGEYYCEHLAEGLLRGDIVKRSQALEIQHRRGIVSDNEWRELENRNPTDGGDVWHFQLAEGRTDESGNVLPMQGQTTATPTAPAQPPTQPTDPNNPQKAG